MREQQIPLEAPHAEIGVETHHDEYDVDVGGDDLFIGHAHQPSCARTRCAEAAPRQSRPCPDPAGARTATQSPTAGNSLRLAARCFNRPETVASRAPRPVQTR